MTPDEMRARTDQFSVDIINFCRRLPPDPFTRKLALQLHDAGTSVASNYHAACRAQSRAQFIAKLSISLEEADECVGWLHKLSVTGQANGPALTALQQEANELVAILSASRRRPSRDASARVRESAIRNSQFTESQSQITKLAIAQQSLN